MKEIGSPIFPFAVISNTTDWDIAAEWMSSNTDVFSSVQSFFFAQGKFLSANRVSSQEHCVIYIAVRPIALIIILVGFVSASLNGADCGVEGSSCTSGTPECCSTGYSYCDDEGVTVPFVVLNFSRPCALPLVFNND